MSPDFWHHINALEHMNIHILVTVNNPNLADLSTLVFKTLRTGFPTADFHVIANNKEAETLVFKATEGIEGKKVLFNRTGHRHHHAQWIADIVASSNTPTVILDPDVIFWGDVQSALAALPAGPLLHGRYVPGIWNEWAGCPSVPRLHTSLLYIPDPAALRTALRNAYPRAHEPLGEYCPCDPWSPAVRFDRGSPTFWDTAAHAYNMIAEMCRPFDHHILDLYTHVNSPTFHDEFIKRMEHPEDYTRVLNLALTEPDRLRGIWKAEDMYYTAMQDKLNDLPQSTHPTYPQG